MSDIDLSIVPYELLAAELARRNGARRKTHGGGRPPKAPACCLRCRAETTANRLRMHPRCPHGIIQAS